MPNLYITNNNTKTTVGLSNERKTTPSLVVTCGNTTYYGSLTTCAAWATTPNKIVVTSGSTTYYTMSPAKGNKFVNFIIPRECPAIDGAVMAKCCVGIAGSSDYNKNSVRIERLTNQYGALDRATLQAPNSGLVKALLYDSPDTTISHYDLITPSRSHTHDTSIVFDDNFTYSSQLIINTKHKGVRVCNNYQTAPNFIYVGCRNNSMGNLKYDYLCINGANDKRSRSIAYTTFSFNRTTDSGNTSVDRKDDTYITYTSMANGPIQTRVGCGDDYYIAPGHYVNHSHHPNPYSGSHMAISCYNEGYTIPWFGVNMMCYDNDIDKLPSNTLLFTDYPIECFDQRYWELENAMSSLGVYPFTNGNIYGNIHADEVKMFCWSPSNYDSTFITYSSVIDIASLGMWPDSCNGSVGNCTYIPILGLEHTHPNPNNTLYFCAKTYAEPGLGVNLVSPGKYIIRHK